MRQQHELLSSSSDEDDGEVSLTDSQIAVQQEIERIQAQIDEMEARRTQEQQ